MGRGRRNHHPDRVNTSRTAEAIARRSGGKKVKKDVQIHDAAEAARRIEAVLVENNPVRVQYVLDLCPQRVQEEAVEIVRDKLDEAGELGTYSWLLPDRVEVSRSTH